jgi:hypothetical protein
MTKRSSLYLQNQIICLVFEWLKQDGYQALNTELGCSHNTYYSLLGCVEKGEVFARRLGETLGVLVLKEVCGEEDGEVGGEGWGNRGVKRVGKGVTEGYAPYMGIGRWECA